MARLTQNQVRLNFVKANPGVRIRGRGGYWYRCALCGKWCGRPGRENAYIPESEKMEVDHIIPWAKGGSDNLSNLRPLCKPCNRARSANCTGFEVAGSLTRAAFEGTLPQQLGNIAWFGVKRKLGIKTKRT